MYLSLYVDVSDPFVVRAEGRFIEKRICLPVVNDEGHEDGSQLSL